MNKRLKELRKHLDLTQEEFAKKIGIKRNTLANYEIGRNEPIDGIIFSICRVYNVNEEWLRTGEGEMFELLTEQEKVMKYAGQLLKDTDSVVAEAIKAFIVTYEQLDDANKKMLNSTVLKFIDNLKKSQ